MKFGILKNEFDDGHLNWIAACEKFDSSYELIDLVSSNWLNIILAGNFDGFFACPPGREDLYKKLYDERIYILNKILNQFVYPNYDEISIHENKKYLAYWLNANNLPYPKTWIFYHKNEALSFIENTNLPLVGKMNIGASGKGVKIFRDRQKLREYVNLAFNTGLRQEWGPNIKMGDFYSRISKIIRNPTLIIRKLKIYQKNYNATQKGFIIMQEYIQHNYEWRVVKIGDSYFGHQKVKQGDKASGTKGIDFIAPPEKLLTFTKELCERFGFKTMAVDMFEDGKGGYLINEMQCIFGHVQEYICEKNGKPGRFQYLNNRWVFEEGLFNSNLSYDLRFNDAKKILQGKG